MLIRKYSRTYWTVARQMAPNELYVDFRESNHYDDKRQAQIDADARNVILQASIAAGNNVMSPDSAFMAVKITTTETVATE